MHPDQANIDVALVQRLIITQFPKWANLPVKTIESAGTDNAIFRLGEDMAIRLPFIADAAPHIDKEYEWLPKLAPLLPLAIPTPIAKGAPGEGYDWPWYICHWLNGASAVDETITDFAQAATDLGNFVASLQKVDTTNAPASRRGRPLKVREPETTQAIAMLKDVIDTDRATDIWQAALAAPLWQGSPVWIHGDLHASNILTQNGRISAIIDFGTSGIGDPACDMMAAWTLLSAETREQFREIVKPDDATWLRGKGWALSFGLVAFPYYKDTNPVLAGIAWHAISEVLAEMEQR